MCSLHCHNVTIIVGIPIVRSNGLGPTTPALRLEGFPNLGKPQTMCSPVSSLKGNVVNVPRHPLNTPRPLLLPDRDLKGHRQLHHRLTTSSNQGLPRNRPTSRSAWRPPINHPKFHHPKNDFDHSPAPQKMILTIRCIQVISHTHHHSFISIYCSLSDSSFVLLSTDFVCSTLSVLEGVCNGSLPLLIHSVMIIPLL